VEALQAPASWDAGAEVRADRRRAIVRKPSAYQRVSGANACAMPFVRATRRSSVEIIPSSVTSISSRMKLCRGLSLLSMTPS
jgi:hypothetical protein